MALTWHNEMALTWQADKEVDDMVEWEVSTWPNQALPHGSGQITNDSLYPNFEKKYGLAGLPNLADHTKFGHMTIRKSFV
jgi:hypothetical protein